MQGVRHHSVSSSTDITIIFSCINCLHVTTNSEELHFVVKSIATHSFDECDMEVLAAMGNRRCNEHYMARFSVNDWDLLDLPSEMDDGRMLLRSKMRVFVEEKYVHKRWLESDGQQRYSQHESSVGR